MALLLLRAGAWRRGKGGVDPEAQAHPSRCASEAPPSAFPQKPESAGRVHWLAGGADSRGTKRTYHKHKSHAMICCWLFSSCRPCAAGPHLKLTSSGEIKVSMRRDRSCNSKYAHARGR